MTSDLERCVKDAHGTVNGVYRAPPTDHSVLSTAPQAAQKPNTHQSCLPNPPPCTVFLGNLPCDVTEDSVQSSLEDEIPVWCTRLEPNRLDRLNRLGYAEFEDLGDLLSALCL